MPVPIAAIIGIAIQQLGIRAIPVLLRTGQTAMRYIITSPGSKGNITKELAKKYLPRGSVVDDIGSLTVKVKNNPVNKVLDPKKLSMAERDALMQTTYRDSAKLLQKHPSYPLNAKLAKDIETGFGGKFDKVFSSRNFIAGDRTAVTVAKATEKLVEAPKQLPKPIATGPTTAEIVKARVSAGMGIPGRETLKTIPKVDRSKIIKLEKAHRKIKKAATGQPANVILRRQRGIEKALENARRTGSDDVAALEAELSAIKTTSRATGEVISEGLRGVGTAPKPAWWQGAIPSWLRVGGKAYEGAYPGAVSADRIMGGVSAGGMLFAGGSAIHGAIQEAGLEFEGPPEITTEQLMSDLAEDYKNSYDSTVTRDSTNVILPSAVE